MKRIYKALLIIGLTIGGTSCSTLYPLAITGATVAGAAYIVANATEPNNTVVVNQNGDHVVVTDAEETKVITCHTAGNTTTINHSNGTHATIIDNGAHKVVSKSDGTSATIIDHGAHKVIIGSDGSHKVVVTH